MTRRNHLSSEEVKTALKRWHKLDKEGGTLEGLFLVQAGLSQGLGVRHATNALLLQGLERLEQENPEQANLLRDRFIAGRTMQTIAHRTNRVESGLYVLQQQAIGRLTDLLKEMDAQAYAAWEATLGRNLPMLSYTELIGVEGVLRSLAQLLVDEGAPQLISIEGIGGIGKTSLADALLRHMLQGGRFTRFGWVSAQTTLLSLDGSLSMAPQPALTVEALVEALVSDVFGVAPFSLEEGMAALEERLSKHPYLIVIDNLETLPDVEMLLPILRRLRGPARFLLTSRESHYGEGDVFHFPVPELGMTDALRLVRREAAQRNFTHLIDASDEELRPIYDTVGGNPLALRLVVGQSYVHSLQDVLEDLMAARGKAERLYTYIYRRAWEHLDEAGQTALLAMPLLPPTAGTFDDLLAISEIEPATLRAALDHLATQNLIDVRGEAGAQRYSIHNLTRAFLHEAVALWQ
jgi:LuxR family glucitol operon transcriptional activator